MPLIVVDKSDCVMLIQLIHEQAENRFLDMLQMQHNKLAGRAALLCSFSRTRLRLAVDPVLLLLKDILHDYEGEVYFCADGDMVLCWRGRVKEIRHALIHAFSTNYSTMLERYDQEQLYRLFDIEAHGEELRILFRNKLQEQHVRDKNPDRHPAVCTKETVRDKCAQSEFSDAQFIILRRSIMTRESRKSPEILIVEDQDFSRRLLMGVLEKQYVCHAAANAVEAIGGYAEHAPDITFLDIELPDIDGHTLAALFKKHDARSWVVMVTGNNFIADVEKAKANKVQGFIVKPFTRQKIIGVIDSFIARKKG